MTRVCLVGAPDVTLRADLRASETARDALSTYEVTSPWENTVCVETISLGAAVSLLNDLNWYLVRLTEAAMVLEPSVSEAEWLSRALATEIRNETVDPAETGSLLKIYGIIAPDTDSADSEADAQPDPVATVGGPAEEPGGDAEGESSDPVDDGRDTRGNETDGLLRLTEPMYAQRVTDETPEYDLRAVDDTLVVRVTPDEFGG